jgi:hypothetical protein
LGVRIPSGALFTSGDAPLVHLQGVPAAVIAAWLGRADVAFTMRTYVYSHQQTCSDAFDQVDNTIADVGSHCARTSMPQDRGEFPAAARLVPFEEHFGFTSSYVYVYETPTVEPPHLVDVVDTAGRRKHPCASIGPQLGASHGHLTLAEGSDWLNAETRPAASLRPRAAVQCGPTAAGPTIPGFDWHVLVIACTRGIPIA